MKYNKMWLDTHPSNNPPNTTRINKNLIISSGQTLENSKGTNKIESYGDKTLIGFIYLDGGDIALFHSTDYGFVQGASQKAEGIGILNTKGIYTKVVEYGYDSVGGNILDLNPNYPVHGGTYKNDKGERIIYWVNGISPLKYLNIDNVPLVIEASKISANIYFDAPIISTDINNGGTLPSGAYYPIFQYQREDGVKSSWSKHYNPIFIFDGSLDSSEYVDGIEPDRVTNKQIRISIQRDDRRFKKLHIGYVYSANNILTAYKVNTINLDFNDPVVYITGSEMKEAVSLEEVVVDKPAFSRVGLVTTLQDTIYIADVSEFKEGNKQYIANDLGQYFQWYSKVSSNIKEVSGFKVDLLLSKSHLDNSKERAFAHGEIYALFVAFEYDWGLGQWWHIPGRELTANERQPYYIFNPTSFRQYQIKDTCTVLDKGLTFATGTFSGWENQDEDYTNNLYPNGKVRHFKFPTLEFMRENVYKDENYGTQYLDKLGIKQNIPSSLFTDLTDEHGNKVKGYRIGYAKRTLDNATNLGQSVYTSTINNLTDNKFYSFGSNFGRVDEGNVPADKALKNNIRVYPFELLFERRLIKPNYIRLEYGLHADNGGMYSFDSATKSRASVYDFVLNGTSKFLTQSLIKVIDSTYLIYNTIKDKYINTFLEEAIVVELQENIDDYPEYTETRANIRKEESTSLVTLLSIKKNMYTQFWKHQIVDTEYRLGDEIIWGGDTYISDYSINQYSRILDSLTYSNDVESEDNQNTVINGNRYAKRFLVESMYNIGLRYIATDTSKGQTEYYPKSKGASDRGGYLLEAKRDKYTNAFINGYSKDYNAQNILNAIYPFDPTITRQVDHPFYVYRGFDSSKELGNKDWLNFRVNDYYELSPRHGKLVNLTVGNEGLLFHHTDALLKTRTRNYINTTGDQAFVGYGDLFEGAPIEIIHRDYGSLGTQHKWSCISTPIGYGFLDSNAKRFYIVGEGIQVISDSGFIEFFKEHSDCRIDNPFTSMGFIAAWDEELKRLILSKRAKKLLPQYESKFKGVWKDTPNFVNSLVAGDIVIKDNQYIKIL